jgi:hypothetical protein
MIHDEATIYPMNIPAFRTSVRHSSFVIRHSSFA